MCLPRVLPRLKRSNTTNVFCVVCNPSARSLARARLAGRTAPLSFVDHMQVMDPMHGLTATQNGPTNDGPGSPSPPGMPCIFVIQSKHACSNRFEKNSVHNNPFVLVHFLPTDLFNEHPSLRVAYRLRSVKNHTMPRYPNKLGSPLLDTPVVGARSLRDRGRPARPPGKNTFNMKMLLHADGQIRACCTAQRAGDLNTHPNPGWQHLLCTRYVPNYRRRGATSMGLCFAFFGEMATQPPLKSPWTCRSVPPAHETTHWSWMPSPCPATRPPDRAGKRLRWG